MKFQSQVLSPLNRRELIGTIIGIPLAAALSVGTAQAAGAPGKQEVPAGSMSDAHSVQDGWDFC